MPEGNPMLEVIFDILSFVTSSTCWFASLIATTIRSSSISLSSLTRFSSISIERVSNLVPLSHNTSSLARHHLFLQSCNGQPTTNMDCCTVDRPCNIGEGDCDYDVHCRGGLLCGHDNCFRDFPVQYGFNWEIFADCCYGNCRNFTEL